MKRIRETNKNEVILEFLKGELSSKRFNDKLNNTLSNMNILSSIITNGNIFDNEENIIRHNIMYEYRNDLLKNFPKIDKWIYVEFDESDIYNINYIDYDYWNILSNNTSKPTEAAKNIKNGTMVFDVSNQPFIDGLEYLKTNKFPPIILITCNNNDFLIIEGHSRMTVYGLEPKLFDNTYGFIGYCSTDEMSKYDYRMVTHDNRR